MTAQVFSLAEIDEAVALFWKNYGHHRIFALSGTMGVGKTTWVHALCRLLGVKDAVSSPTFSLINHYCSESGTDIYHLDLYRLSTCEEAMDAGVGELLESSSICLIEWPEIIQKELPSNTLWINFEIVSAQQRSLKVSSGE